MSDVQLQWVYDQTQTSLVFAVSVVYVFMQYIEEKEGSI